MIRTFIAVEIPVFAEFERLLSRLKTCGARMSVPRAEGMHVTLKFLGDVQEDAVGRISEVLSEAVSETPSFEAGLQGMGGFPDLRNPRVLWAGIQDGGGMARISELIDDSLSKLGFAKETRRFTPHVTVARVKSPAGIERAIDVLREYENAEFGTFKIDAVKLKKSTLAPSGSIYEDLSVARLR